MVAALSTNIEHVDGSGMCAVESLVTRLQRSFLYLMCGGKALQNNGA